MTLKLHRNAGIRIKEIAADASPGTFAAIVSVFGNVDSAKEVVLPGAFKNSLIQRGMPKVCWGHDWLEIIGSAKEAEEWAPGDSRLPPDLSQNGGLYVLAELDMNVQKAQEAHSLLTKGHVDEFSIGYKVIRAHRITEEGGQVDDTLGYGYFEIPKSIRYLDELELYEISPVLAGANDRTALLGVKDGMPFGDKIELALEAFKSIYAEAVEIHERRLKEGRTFSSANMAKLEGFAGSLEDISSGLRDLLKPSKSEDDEAKRKLAADALAEMAQFEELQFRLHRIRVGVG